jgi:hypothetical protein
MCCWNLPTNDSATLPGLRDHAAAAGDGLTTHGRVWIMLHLLPHKPRPRAVTYREAMSALHDAYQTLHDLFHAPRMPPNAREQLELLMSRLEILVVRDDGRRR